MHCKGTLHVGCCFVVVVALLLQGCQSLYLHSSDMETRTQAAKDDLGKINIDKAFTDAKARLDAFAVDEEAGVAAYVVAQRNKEIADLVRRNLLDDSDTTSVGLLEANVARRAEQILGVGRDAVKTRLSDTTLADLPGKFDLLEEDAAVNKSFIYVGALKDFGALKRDDDVRPVDCEKTPPSISTPPTTAVDVAYVRIVEACNAYNEATKRLADARKTLAPAPKSELQAVIDKWKQAKETIALQTVEAGRIQALIKKLQADPPSNAADLEAAIKKIRDLLRDAKGIAAAAGSEEISKVLEDLLAADLSAKYAADAPPPSRLTKGTLAVLELTTALARASDAFSSQPQVVRVNSTLLAIAEQRQALDMAKLTIEQQNAEVLLLAAEEHALIREVALLSTTQRIAGKTFAKETSKSGFAVIGTGTDSTRQGVGAALAAYVESWNQGRIPYTVLRFREFQLQREFIVRRAAKTAKNWTALLSPPLDDLVAYGKGGIRPETVATVITNLGIMGAILGK